MSKVIYKYALDSNFQGDFVFQAPRMAKIVHFGFQNNQPMLWAEVDSEDTTKTVYPLRVVATGEIFPAENYIYITTCFNGPFVWHLYKKIF